MIEDDANIEVEITGPEDFHCFRLILNARPGDPEAAERQPIEILLHGRALIELIYKSSLALSDWQAATSQYLLQRISGDTGQSAGRVDISFFAEVAMLAQAVAAFDWRTSVTEREHFERIEAMNRLRAALDKRGGHDH
jgi:hypothetical protein